MPAYTWSPNINSLWCYARLRGVRILTHYGVMPAYTWSPNINSLWCYARLRGVQILTHYGVMPADMESEY